MPQPRFSIASYSFHSLFSNGAMTLVQYLETVRYRYGLQTADIWSPMIASFEDGYLNMVRAQMDERGLSLVNLCCDLAHVWTDDENEERLCSQTARDVLKAARILGAQTIRIDMGIGPKQATDEQIEHCAKKYDEYCKVADGFGAKLGTENHWGASTDIAVIRKLFQAVKAKNFAVLLHLGNWQCDTQDEKDACDIEIAPKAMHMHLHYDACVNADKQLPPLAAAGYAGAWAVECGKGTNEYNNVSFQLAQARRVVSPLDYQMNRSGGANEGGKILMRKVMQSRS